MIFEKRLELTLLREATLAKFVSTSMEKGFFHLRRVQERDNQSAAASRLLLPLSHQLRQSIRLRPQSPNHPAVSAVPSTTFHLPVTLAPNLLIATTL